MVKRYINKKMSISEIQSILNDGGYIEFENGIYNITKTLLLGKNKVPTIINLNKSTLRQSSTINHIFLTYSDKNTIGYNGACNIEIYNGNIEGIGKYRTKLNFITLCHSNNIYIHDMKFVDIVEFHDIEINSSRNITIKNCKFHGFNSSIDKDDFRECIQIDWAVESALVVVPLGSLWYDGTPCENITIDNCEFGKSSSRPAPSQCIGNHCQVSGKKHNNIIIKNCKFIGGDQTNKNGACINLIGMENIKISNNECTEFGRFLKMNTSNYSYNNKGEKIKTKLEDGVCKNIIIENNIVNNPSGTCKHSGIYSCSNTGNHELIYICNNNISSGLNKYMTCAISLSNTNYGIIKNNNINKLKTYIGNTCEGIIEID